MLRPEVRRSIEERVARARILVAGQVPRDRSSELHWREGCRATITVLCNNIETLLDDLEAGDRPPMRE